MAEGKNVDNNFRATVFLDENFSFLNDVDAETQNVQDNNDKLTNNTIIGHDPVDESNEIEKIVSDNNVATVSPSGIVNWDVVDERTLQSSKYECSSSDAQLYMQDQNYSGDVLEQRAESKSPSNSDLATDEIITKDESTYAVVDSQAGDNITRENTTFRNSKLTASVVINQSFGFLNQFGDSDSDSSGSSNIVSRTSSVHSLSDGDTCNADDVIGASSNQNETAEVKAQSLVKQDREDVQIDAKCPLDGLPNKTNTDEALSEENSKSATKTCDSDGQLQGDASTNHDVPIESTSYQEKHCNDISGDVRDPDETTVDKERHLSSDNERNLAAVACDDTEVESPLACNHFYFGIDDGNVNATDSGVKASDTESGQSKEVIENQNEIASETASEIEKTESTAADDFDDTQVTNECKSNNKTLSDNALNSEDNQTEEHTSNFYFGLEVSHHNNDTSVRVSGFNSENTTLSNSDSPSSTLSNPNSRTSTLSNHGSRSSTLSNQEKQSSDESSPGQLRLPLGHQRNESTSTTMSERDSMVKYYAQRQHVRRIDRQDSVTTYKRLTRKYYDIEKVITLEKEAGSDAFGFHLLGGAPAYVITVNEGGVADRHGVCVGDMLITVNGCDVMDSSVEEVAQIILSVPDKVVLGLSRCTSPLTPEQPPLKSGYLHKLSGLGLRKSWKKRWIELKQDNCLYQYKTDKDKAPLGVICLSNFVVTKATDLDREHAFKLAKYERKTYHFAAKTDDDMSAWAATITSAAENRSKTLFTLASGHNISIPALAIKDPECTGHMTKQGNSHKTWKKRYFVLKDASLYYYKDVNSTTAKGVAQLHGYKVEVDYSYKHKRAFSLLPPYPSLRTFYFYVENTREKDRWTSALRKSIDKWHMAEEPINS